MEILVVLQLRTLLTRNHGLLQREIPQVEKSKIITQRAHVFIRGPEMQELVVHGDEQYTVVSFCS